MSIPDPKPIEEYKTVYATISPRLGTHISEKARDITDSFLMMYPEPKDYRNLRAFSQIASDSTLLWLLTEGYVTLNPEWVITDEESAEREVEQAARKVDSGGAVARMPGGYV